MRTFRLMGFLCKSKKFENEQLIIFDALTKSAVMGSVSMLVACEGEIKEEGLRRLFSKIEYGDGLTRIEIPIKNDIGLFRRDSGGNITWINIEKLKHDPEGSLAIEFYLSDVALSIKDALKVNSIKSPVLIDNSNFLESILKLIDTELKNEEVKKEKK